MSRNLVICCDGTGNEIEENLSNVLKLYRTLQRDDTQIAFYDAGIGTIGDAGNWSRLKSRTQSVFGLMTGAGLDENVLDAYRFLIRNWREGDQVFLFGFSRGAYTVRVLAGFLYLVGLLDESQENLAGYAFTAYKKAGYAEIDFDRHRGRGNLNIAWQVEKILQTRYVPIRFVGCWDTVASVIVPRRDRMFLPSLLTLPYTRTNPAVQTFRHALAIDERRRMFRVNSWKDDQEFTATRQENRESAPRQDIRQVWFAGVHADVGGGYPETESGPAKYPLGWMIGEARAAGLRFQEAAVSRMVDGTDPDYVRPDPQADLHDSLNFAWRVLEWLPRRLWRSEWPDRRGLAGFYLPRAEPRRIPDGAEIHWSVFERKRYSKALVAYKPVNLPENHVRTERPADGTVVYARLPAENAPP